jgi:hypothetical protein
MFLFLHTIPARIVLIASCAYLPITQAAASAAIINAPYLGLQGHLQPQRPTTLQLPTIPSPAPATPPTPSTPPAQPFGGS